jgi:hypothetical protein
MVRDSRRHRQIIAHVGLPEGYRGAAGPLLAVLGLDLDQLVAAVTAELGEVQRWTDAHDSALSRRACWPSP